MTDADRITAQELLERAEEEMRLAIAAQLDAARLKQHLTITRLAHIAYVHPNTAARALRGCYGMQVTSLIRLAQALHLSLFRDPPAAA